MKGLKDLSNQVTITEDSALGSGKTLADLKEIKEGEGYVEVTHYMHEAFGLSIVMEMVEQ